ncbi:DMT family transporter [Peribacillus acanthi]|uniref:DMT family transporter n=1 Tax=Peribacillus acanthi TaxID=2171554 RepID=UPI000D3EB482|nr:DMT family transporter [Peribacillus acanthi]
MKQTFLGSVYLSLAASIWGGMYVVSKYVLDYIPPITLVWLRFIIAFIVLFAILRAVQTRTGKQVQLKKRDWILLGWIGFIGYFISISFQFIGTKLSDAHTGALITSATPAFIVIFAILVLKEKLTARKTISMLLATTGVVIVIGWETKVGHHLTGSLILVGAAITWALLSIYVKIASERFSTLTITTFAIGFGLLFTTPVMLWELQSQNVFFHNIWVVLGIVYLGTVSTAGAFFLWNKGMELMDAGVGSLFFFFQPVVGTFLGWLLLNEEIHANFFIGAILIFAGVLIVTVKRNEAS